jgi:uncharacterized protein (DUF1778 family)
MINVVIDTNVFISSLKSRNGASFKFNWRNKVMSTLNLRLPDSVHEKIKQFAKAEGISINQFIASAALEKISAFATVDYLKSRAKKANEDLFLQALEAIPDVIADKKDLL